MFAEPSLHLAVWRMFVMRPRPTADRERMAQIVAIIAAADAEAIAAYLKTMEPG
jgi:hypothetical protein